MNQKIIFMFRIFSTTFHYFNGFEILWVLCFSFFFKFLRNINNSRKNFKNILAEPKTLQFPDAVKSKPITVIEDRPFTLSCRSTGGKPAAKLAWVISKDPNGDDINNWLDNAAQILQDTSGLVKFLFEFYCF